MHMSQTELPGGLIEKVIEVVKREKTKMQISRDEIGFIFNFLVI